MMTTPEIEQSVGKPSVADTANDSGASLGSRILTLLFLVRSSGATAYRQRLGLAESEIRLLAQLARRGPMTTSQLAQSSGMFTSHTSRATTALVAEGLLERDYMRAPFRLTKKGKALVRRILRVAQTRHEQITADLTEDDRDFIVSRVERLSRLGEHWLAQEEALHSEREVRDDDEVSVDVGSDDLAEDPLIPSLVSLSMIMGKSALLAWRRMTGISAFDWVVLSRVAEAGRIRLKQLAFLTGRDKSQVWRTVVRLTDTNLVRKETHAASRELELTVTDAGAAIYAVTADYSARRNVSIIDAMGEDAAARFRALVERMIDNTRGMMNASATTSPNLPNATE